MGCGASIPVKAMKGSAGRSEREPAKVMKGEYTQMQEAKLIREKSMRDRRIKILQAADEKAEKAFEEREHLSLGNRSRGTSRATSRTNSPNGKKKHVLFKSLDEKMNPLEEKYISQETERIEDTQANRERKSDKPSLRKSNSFKDQGIDSEKDQDFSEIISISPSRMDIPKNPIANSLIIVETNSSFKQEDSNDVTESRSRALTQTPKSDAIKIDVNISQNDSKDKLPELKEKRKKKSHSKDVENNIGLRNASEQSNVDSSSKGGENHRNKLKRKKKGKDQEEMLGFKDENKIQVRDEDRAHSRSSVRSDASSKRG